MTFAEAVVDAFAANDLTTIVAKVEAVGPTTSTWTWRCRRTRFDSVGPQRPRGEEKGPALPRLVTIGRSSLRGLVAGQREARLRILIVGAGPAGLYLAYLLRRQRRDADITLAEQNPPVLTRRFRPRVLRARAGLPVPRTIPRTHDLIVPAMETWRDLAIVPPGPARANRRHRVLGDRPAEAAGALQPASWSPKDSRRAFARRSEGAAEMRGYDLVVGADGVTGRPAYLRATGIRHECPPPCARTSSPGTAPGGVSRLLNADVPVPRVLGPATAHHYPYAPDRGTFLVECGRPRPGGGRGLGAMDEAASARPCANESSRPPSPATALVSNRSIWRTFPRIRNERWSVGTSGAHRRRAAHGALLDRLGRSPGDGGRDRARPASREHPRDVRVGLQVFEAARRPIVEKLVAAAERERRVVRALSRSTCAPSRSGSP